MTDEQEIALYQGWTFGLGVAAHLRELGRPHNMAEEDAVLRQVASGELTLVSNPTETMAKFPRMAEGLREAIMRGTPELIAHEREIANAIIRARDRTAEDALRKMRGSRGPPE